MPNNTTALRLSEPDTALLKKLALAERFTLAAVTAIAAVNLVGEWLMSVPGTSLLSGWHPMRPETALVVLLSVLSLLLRRPHHSERAGLLGLLSAALVILLSAVGMAECFFHFSLAAGAARSSAHLLHSAMEGGGSVQTATGFAFLGIAMMVTRAHRRLAVYGADLLTFCLVWLVLVLVAGHFIGMMPEFDSFASVNTSTSTMICLFLLTGVVFLRRACEGVFSILLGRGMGSRIARTLSPLLLTIPYLREVARAHFMSPQRMPTHYTTAFLASLAVVLSFTLLLFLAWRINGMEIEIHELSLRDTLTDLYNLRGFHLMAEQSLRLAQRSNLPFSVLYLDFDNLKQINDSLGHQAGSEFLVETAAILRTSFRETDVVARIGGDEFAVAGQFSQPAIALAAQHLGVSAAQRNAESDRRIALSFSVGHVTSDPAQRPSLDELLVKADQAMYEEKRRKRVLAN